MCEYMCKRLYPQHTSYQMDGENTYRQQVPKAATNETYVYRPPPASFFSAASKSHYWHFWGKVFVFLTKK